MDSSLTKDLLNEIQRNLVDVERLDFQSGPDSEGEPANWIWVVLRADAPKEAWSWDNRQLIRSKVIDEVQKANVPGWVYVRFRDEDEGAQPSTASTVSST